MRWPAFKLKDLSRFAAIAAAAVLLTACAGTNVVADKSRRFDQAAAAYDAGDYSMAYSIWSQLAAENDLAAMRNTAHMLRRGLGVEKNLGKALDLYTESARKGMVLAMANVAEMHMNGEGTLKDPEEAARWYAMAANGGLSIAMVRLAEMLEQGNGVPKDPAKARELYAQAAKNGYAPAVEKTHSASVEPPRAPAPAPPTVQPMTVAVTSSDAARRQSTPVVDDLDRRAAIESPRRQPPPPPAQPLSKQAAFTLEPLNPASLTGMPEQDAQKLQAGWVAYQAGQMRDALKVWRSLADKGVAEAQIRVGGMFESGLGVGRDTIEAYRWYRMASAKNNPVAAASAARVAAQLSPAERAIAESMASAPQEWPTRQR